MMRTNTKSRAILTIAFLISSTMAFAPHAQVGSGIRVGVVNKPFTKPELSPKRQSSSSLQMSAAGLSIAKAAAGVFSGGVFAGALHAIAGPDHLAALLPRCCGQPWHRAGRYGALWGMGHALSAFLLGVLGFTLKNRVTKMPALSPLLSQASSAAEIAIGLSLVAIGIMGFRESQEWEEDLEFIQPKPLSAAANDVHIKTTQKRAVVLNGVLHGFSWDGAPSLAGALAVASWRGNLAFLLAYGLGTTGVMTVATSLIGEGTRCAGQVFGRPDIPQKLSKLSSLLAMTIGVVWCGMALA